MIILIISLFFFLLINIVSNNETIALNRIVKWDNPRTSWHYFGASVKIYQNYVVVGDSLDEQWGTRAGAAHVYYWDGTTYNNSFKLSNSIQRPFDMCGECVAINGDYIVIGCPNAQLGNLPRAGMVMIFHRTGINTWEFVQILKAFDTEAFDYFGKEVAIHGTNIVVGASEWDLVNQGNEGAIYIYKKSGSNWFLEQRVISPNPSINGSFGGSVDILNDKIVVGEINFHGTKKGRVYMFYKRTLFPFIWAYNGELVPSSNQDWASYGYDVSITYSFLTRSYRIAVGAPGWDNDPVEGGVIDEGRVFIFEGGPPWRQKAILGPRERESMRFGTSVSIDNEWLLVGAPNEDGNGIIDRGAVYAYKCYFSSFWYLRRIINHPSPNNNVGFGEDVDIFTIGSTAHGISNAMGDDYSSIFLPISFIDAGSVHILRDINIP